MPGTHVLYRRPPWRLQAKAALAALAIHAAALAVALRPVDRSREAVMQIVVVTDLEETPPDLVAPGTTVTPAAADPAPDDPSSGATATDAAASVAAAGDVAPAVARAIPFLPESDSAGETSRLPFTALVETHAAALPLVVGEGGRIGRRRLDRTPAQIAAARADSLLFARMAGIAVAERRDTGAVGLANGGVTLAIPWSGFLPADRSDGEWRKQRCSGDGGGDSDKAGEAEARGAQCR
jgi:hypothetical protein